MKMMVASTTRTYSIRPIMVSRRKRYHSDEDYRKRVILKVVGWQKKNRDKVNETKRKHYANLPPEVKKVRLEKLKKMRQLGKWKK